MTSSDRRKRVLGVRRTPDGALAHELSLRREFMEVEWVDSVDHARRAVTSQRWDAVLVCPGQKQLGLRSFVRFVTTRFAPALIVLLDATEPGALTLASSSPRRVVEQLCHRLGLRTSLVWSYTRVADLGSSGGVTFSSVTTPETATPVLLVEAPVDDLDADALLRAQHAGVLRNEGLAQTLETFWDDPQPHVLQSLPSGVSLSRLWNQRRLLGVELASSILRGLCDGVVALHEAGHSVGRLSGHAVWLTEAGRVLLLGHGPMQVRRAMAAPYYGLQSDAPPEEYGAMHRPEIPGDAFHLAVLLMRLAVDERPFSTLPIAAYLERNWEFDVHQHAPALRSVSSVLESCLQPYEVDRPRGALLREVFDAVAPKNRQVLVAQAVRSLA